MLFNFLFFVILSDLRTAFDLLDRDQDGQITPNELKFMLKNLGIDLSDELVDGLMKEASRTGEDSLFFGIIYIVRVFAICDISDCL
jgi:Ca2+-binding EF-hand superfamily protein